VPEHLLGKHIKATYGRLREAPVILAVQETSFFNRARHPAAQELGPISERGWGRVGHGTLAVTPERLVLGVLAQRHRVREDKEWVPHEERAIEDKESSQWLDSVEALTATRQALPGTTFVGVGNREADVFELLTMERPLGASNSWFAPPGIIGSWTARIVISGRACEMPRRRARSRSGGRVSPEERPEAAACRCAISRSRSRRLTQENG
jgi:hypothetical protein